MLSRPKTLWWGTVTFIGYMLSPLSWWNDLYVNIPLAYAIAWPISYLGKNSFLTAFVAAYWLTNLLGFMLMHCAANSSVDGCEKGISRKRLLLDIGIALLYSMAMVALVKYGYLKPPTEYLK